MADSLPTAQLFPLGARLGVLKLGFTILIFDLSISVVAANRQKR
jgi:hypothetical protein